MNVEDIKEDVEEVLRSSQEKYSTGGRSCVVDSEKDLEQIIEVIRQVYKQKPFDALEWEATWAGKVYDEWGDEMEKEEETYRVSLTKRSDVLITAENSMDLIKKIKEKYPFEEVEAFVLLSKTGEEV